MLYYSIKKSAEEGRYYINTQTEGGCYKMTMPITDRQSIQSLLEVMDEDETRDVLKNVLKKSWVS